MDAHTRALRRYRHSTLAYTYMITTVTHRRRPLFNRTEWARIVAESMAFFDERKLVHTFASVVMPDHIHWVFKLRRSDLPTIVRRLKNWTGKEINALRGTEGEPVWQRGHHDHCLTRTDLLDRAIHYVRMNPVVAEMVQEPEDYPWLYVGERDPDWDGDFC